MKRDNAGKAAGKTNMFAATAPEWRIGRSKNSVPPGIQGRHHEPGETTCEKSVAGWLLARSIRRVLFSLTALAMLGLLLPGGLGAQGSTPTAKDPGVTSVSPPPSSLSGAERLRYHVLSTVGVGAFAGPVLGAGLAQWRDVPPEWGEGMSGFGQRYGFRLGQNATEQVIQFGAGAALRQDPRYFRSQNAGFWRRVGHAISYTFTAPTASGSRQPAVFRFAGAYGGAAISKTWYPGERETWKHTLALGSTSLAFDAASNLGLEFWPDIKKRLFRRR